MSTQNWNSLTGRMFVALLSVIVSVAWLSCDKRQKVDAYPDSPNTPLVLIRRHSGLVSGGGRLDVVVAVWPNRCIVRQSKDTYEKGTLSKADWDELNGMVDGVFKRGAPKHQPLVVDGAFESLCIHRSGRTVNLAASLPVEEGGSIAIFQAWLMSRTAEESTTLPGPPEEWASVTMLCPTTLTLPDE